MMKGYAVGMFHGYQVDGIYKSEDEVRNYKNDAGGAVLPYGTADAASLNPSQYVGQFKVKDVNNDGKIDASDRTFIGNPHPDLTGGVNLSVGWKGFDLSTYLYFSVGNDIFAMYKYYTHYGSLQSAYSKIVATTLGARRIQTESTRCGQPLQEKVRLRPTNLIPAT